jgi:hypothetical protein
LCERVVDLLVISPIPDCLRNPIKPCTPMFIDVMIDPLSDLVVPLGRLFLPLAAGSRELSAEIFSVVLCGGRDGGSEWAGARPFRSPSRDLAQPVWGARVNPPH